MAIKIAPGPSCEAAAGSAAMIQGLPAGRLPDLIYCARRQLDCAAADCVADYLRVQSRGTQAWRSDWHCRSCPEGADRAGGVSPRAAIPMQHLCCRCHRPAVRFIRERLCPSCDARDREMRRKRNGKGTYPRVLLLHWHPHDERVVVWLDSRWQSQDIGHTSGPLETMLYLTRVLKAPAILVARCAQMRQLTA